MNPSNCTCRSVPRERPLETTVGECKHYRAHIPLHGCTIDAPVCWHRLWCHRGHCSHRGSITFVLIRSQRNGRSHHLAIHTSSSCAFNAMLAPPNCRAPVDAGGAVSESDDSTRGILPLGSAQVRCCQCYGAASTSDAACKAGDVSVDAAAACVMAPRGTQLRAQLRAHAHVDVGGRCPSTPRACRMWWWQDSAHMTDGQLKHHRSMDEHISAVQQKLHTMIPVASSKWA